MPPVVNGHCDQDQGGTGGSQGGRSGGRAAVNKEQQNMSQKQFQHWFDLVQKYKKETQPTERNQKERGRNRKDK